MTARVVAWIDATCFVPNHGYRVSLVVEGEDGHHPTGNWPYDPRKGHTMPWFWGMDIKTAEAACEDYNAQRGISKEEAFKIVTASMAQKRKAK